MASPELTSRDDVTLWSGGGWRTGIPLMSCGSSGRGRWRSCGYSASRHSRRRRYVRLVTTMNPKCRRYWCLKALIDWRYSQTFWYFWPSCELLPLYLLSDLAHPSPPFPKLCVAVGRGGGGRVLSCVVDHILQEFNTLFLTRFRNFKIATPPQKQKHQ